MPAALTGSVLTYALGGSSAPGAQSVTVPADALAVVFFSSWYASAGTTLTITTDFTVDLAATANAINSALVANTDEYIFRGWAKITATGSRTFTPVWNNSQVEGPLLFVAFVKGINPDVAPRDWDGAQARNTTTSPAITLDTNTGDLVLVMNRQYSSGGAIPGLIAGTTSLATLGHRSQGGRMASVDTPGATSTTLTSTVNSYAGIAAIVFAPGAVSLTPSRFDNSQTFYGPTVSTGGATQTLTPARFDNSQTFYFPTVTPGAVTLTPARFDNDQTFHSPTVTPGAVTLTATRFDNAQTFYVCTVSGGTPPEAANGLFWPIVRRRRR